MMMKMSSTFFNYFQVAQQIAALPCLRTEQLHSKQFHVKILASGRAIHNQPYRAGWNSDGSARNLYQITDFQNEILRLK